jgi:serine protease AprX
MDLAALRLRVVVLGVTAALCAVPAAAANDGSETKRRAELPTAVVDKLDTKLEGLYESGAEGAVPVIVFGAPEPVSEAGGSVEEEFELLPAVAATVSADAIDDLATSTEVARVVYDSPVAPTAAAAEDDPAELAARLAEIRRTIAELQEAIRIKRQKLDALEQAAVQAERDGEPALARRYRDQMDEAAGAVLVLREEVRELKAELKTTATVTPGAASEPAPAAPATALATHYPLVDGAPAAWSRGLDGAGLGIAIIDSGTIAHADFGGRLVQVAGPGTRATLEDTYGHGTLVAGIAAGNGAESAGAYVGIAPAAQVVSVNVADPEGATRTSDVIRGLEWVLSERHRHGIRVVSLSLQETAPSAYAESPLNEAVERLWKHGIVVVVSAGNLGAGAAVYAPANDPFVITTGALDTNETADTADDTVPDWSSRGTTLDGFAKPELVAPGRRIVSLLPAGSRLATELPDHVVAPGYGRFSGTSFSAPQVAAAAALLLQANPTWTPDQVKWVLTERSRPVSGSPGALDLARALAFAGEPGSANTGLVEARLAQKDRDRSTAALLARAAAWNDGTWERVSTWGGEYWDRVAPSGAAWNGAAWNGAAWNGAAWNAAAWNGAAWNGAAWNGAAWNGAAWNALVGD